MSKFDVGSFFLGIIVGWILLFAICLIVQYGAVLVAQYPIIGAFIGGFVLMYLLSKLDWIVGF